MENPSNFSFFFKPEKRNNLPKPIHQRKESQMSYIKTHKTYVNNDIDDMQKFLMHMISNDQLEDDGFFPHVEEMLRWGFSAAYQEFNASISKYPTENVLFKKLSITIQRLYSPIYIFSLLIKKKSWLRGWIFFYCHLDPWPLRLSHLDQMYNGYKVKITQQCIYFTLGFTGMIWDVCKQYV